jgi:hypothetical protein
VPKVPAVAQREAQEREREQHSHQRKWEVKFAPQLATASRRTIVTATEVQDYISNITSSTELRTAMGGGGDAMPKHNNTEKLRPVRSHQAQKDVPSQNVPQHDSNQNVGQNGEVEDDEEDEDEYEDEDEDEDEFDDEYRRVPPAGVIEGLMMMLTSSDATEKAKAAAALCNICSETDSNRELVVQSGGLPSLVDMLVNP